MEQYTPIEEFKAHVAESDKELKELNSVKSDLKVRLAVMEEQMKTQTNDTTEIKDSLKDMVRNLEQMQKESIRDSERLRKEVSSNFEEIRKLRHEDHFVKPLNRQKFYAETITKTIIGILVGFILAQLFPVLL